MNAEMPSTAMNVSKMWVTCGTLQLQLVLVSAAKKPSFAQVAASAPTTSLLIGNQNTEKP